MPILTKNILELRKTTQLLRKQAVEFVFWIFRFKWIKKKYFQAMTCYTNLSGSKMKRSVPLLGTFSTVHTSQSVNESRLASFETCLRSMLQLNFVKLFINGSFVQSEAKMVWFSMFSPNKSRDSRFKREKKCKRDQNHSFQR